MVLIIVIFVGSLVHKESVNVNHQSLGRSKGTEKSDIKVGPIGVIKIYTRIDWFRAKELNT